MTFARQTVAVFSRGFSPVIPHRSRSKPSAVNPFRRSTQVNASRNSGSFTSAGAPGSSTGIIGTMLPIFLSFTKRRSRPCISGSSHGPTPEPPKQTADDLQPVTMSSRASCQVSPGRSSHSSSQTERPRCFRAAPSDLTAGLSLPLWLRNTSKFIRFPIEFGCRTAPWNPYSIGDSRLDCEYSRPVRARRRCSG